VTLQPATSLRDYIRRPAEEMHATELAALISAERYPIPAGWRMSPRSVLTYICGGRSGALEIIPKYQGNVRLVELAIATLLTDRALLLVGAPGTAKTWLSEHLAAAISGNSKLVIQGTAGTTEEQVRYGWNVAMLVAAGPQVQALIPGPIYRAMESGTIARFEELTRCPPEVQDALIAMLSEQRLVVPELALDVAARRGFALIATANTSDRGIHEMSAALKRCFNHVNLPAPADFATEVAIVRKRLAELVGDLQLPAVLPGDQLIDQVVTVFRDLRQGMTSDGQSKIRGSSAGLSTAEAISLLTGCVAQAAHFGDGTVSVGDVALALRGAVVKEQLKDGVAWQEYLATVMRKRGLVWQTLYRACSELDG
jgi:MoxR-like ATPase